MNPKVVGWEGMEWILLVQDKDQWRDLVNTVKNARIPKLLGISSVVGRRLVTFILGMIPNNITVKARYANLCPCMQVVNSLEKISEGAASYEAQARCFRIAALEFATHSLSIYSNAQTIESRSRGRRRTAQQIVTWKKERQHWLK
jgi:hypothetical protein